jgi:hypothetical protein
MKKAINLSYVFQTPEFQTFIRGPMGYREAVKHFVKPTFRYLEDNYTSFFGDYYRESSALEEFSSKGMEHDAKFRKVFVFLDKLEEHFRKVSNQMKLFKNDFRTMQILHQEYEERTLKQYSGDTRNPLSLAYEPGSLSEEPLNELLDWISTEKLEYNAILQAIQGRVTFMIRRESLEDKLAELQKAKSSKMKSFFKKIKSIGEDDTYETEDSIRDGILQLEKIINITCHRQAELDFPKFQADRLASFAFAIERFGNILHLESYKLLKVVEEIDSQLA